MSPTPATTRPPANPRPDMLCACCAHRSGEDGLLLGNRANGLPTLGFCGRCVAFLKGAIAAWEGA